MHEVYAQEGKLLVCVQLASYKEGTLTAHQCLSCAATGRAFDKVRLLNSLT